MATVTILEKATGAERTLDERDAKILVALGRARYAHVVDAATRQTYTTRALTAEPARRGRPRKSQSEE